MAASATAAAERRVAERTARAAGRAALGGTAAGVPGGGGPTLAEDARDAGRMAAVEARLFSGAGDGAEVLASVCGLVRRPIGTDPGYEELCRVVTSDI